VKLEGFIADRPYDIEDIQLTVPTLKGLYQGAPASMVDELKALVAANELVWVDEQGKV